MQDRGTPVTKSPAIPALFGLGAKMPLDLYKLFHLVTAEGKGPLLQRVNQNISHFS